MFCSLLFFKHAHVCFLYFCTKIPSLYLSLSNLVNLAPLPVPVHFNASLLLLFPVTCFVSLSYLHCVLTFLFCEDSLICTLNSILMLSNVGRFFMGAVFMTERRHDSKHFVACCQKLLSFEVSSENRRIMTL